MGITPKWGSGIAINRMRQEVRGVEIRGWCSLTTHVMTFWAQCYFTEGLPAVTTALP